MMLSAAGLDFKDNRCSGPPSEGLECNLGRMPTLDVSGHGAVGQSLAQYFFVASTCGFAGSSAFEAAKCLELAEHLKELKTEWSKLVPYGTSPTPEQLDTWFNAGGNDTSGPAGSQGSRYMTWYMGRIEASLTGTDGFAVGSKLSLADILMYNTFAEHLEESESSQPEDKRYPFQSKALSEGALSKYPKISASCNKVKEHAGVQQYLKTRGPQGF